MNYEEVDFGELYHQSSYAKYSYDDTKPSQSDLDAMHKINLDRCIKLEDYRLGKKPYAIRIDSGMYKGSILKVEGLLWTHKTGDHANLLSPAIEVTRIVREWDNSVYYSSQLAGFYCLDYQCEPVMVTDEGKAYKRLFYQECKVKILLDYAGPTVVVTTRKKPVKGKKNEIRTSFDDAFGNEINSGDWMIYHDAKLGWVNLIQFERFASKCRVKLIRPNGESFTKEIGYFAAIKVNIDDESIFTMKLMNDGKGYGFGSFNAVPATLTLKQLTDAVAVTNDSDEEN